MITVTTKLSVIFVN